MNSQSVCVASVTYSKKPQQQKLKIGLNVTSVTNSTKTHSKNLKTILKEGFGVSVTSVTRSLCWVTLVTGVTGISLNVAMCACARISHGSMSSQLLTHAGTRTHTPAHMEAFNEISVTSVISVTHGKCL